MGVMGTDTLIIPTHDGLNRRVVTHDNYTYYYYHNTDWQILEVRRNDEDHNPERVYVWSQRYIDALIVRYYDGNEDGDYEDEDDNILYYTNDANMNLPVRQAGGIVMVSVPKTPKTPKTRTLEELLEILRLQPRPPTVPDELERLVRRYINARRGLPWKINQLLQHVERTWEQVSNDLTDPTNNATERLIGLTFKIRAKTMRGFKAKDKVLAHPYLASFLRASGGVADLRQVI